MTALPGQRMHYCGKCVSGEHELGIDNWDTQHCRLQRECCQCDCDCSYSRVLVEEPRCERRRSERRWQAGRRPPRDWAQRYVHEVIGPPDLSPEEYLDR
jgi:hypothetical protein